MKDYRFAATSSFKQARKKFVRDNPRLKEALWDRLEAIRKSPSTEGKELMYDFAGLREDHFHKSFVFCWKVLENPPTVVFIAFAHKDEYKRQFRAGVVKGRNEGFDL